jgi:hypothetical protein
MIKKYNNTNERKTLHIGITTASHAGFRIQCFKYGLSMQEVIEELVVRIANEEADALELLAELKYNKKTKTIKKLKNTDIESIYDIIDAENPLSDD